MKTPLFQSLRKQVEGTLGYAMFKLGEEETVRLKSVIRDQWLYRIQLLCPGQVKEFAAIEMDRYHGLSHLVDHKAAWPKSARILPPSVVAEIRQMPFTKRLESEYGSFTISDEEDIGWENIYWRLVRPGNTDIGPLHADNWFWEAGHGRTPEGKERVKVWIPLYSEKGKNGLRVIPGSHGRKDFRYHFEKRDGFLKPQIDEDEKDLETYLVPTEPGDAIVFHDLLVHGGAPNLGGTTRVSAEFTLFVEKEA